MATMPAYPSLSQAYCQGTTNAKVKTNVKALQCLLNYRNSNTALLDDGDFGTLTTTAIKSYQSRTGLFVDGIAGPITLGHLIADVKSVANGQAAKAAQHLLSKFEAIVVDGNFGATSDGIAKTFQGKMGLVKDGLIGHISWQYLFGYSSYPTSTSSGGALYVTAQEWPTLSQTMANKTSQGIVADVKATQCFLNYRMGSALLIDGVYGAVTANAIKAFQKSKGLLEDGVAGPKTLSLLVAPVTAGTTNLAVRATQYLLSKFSSTINIDGYFGSVTANIAKTVLNAVGYVTGTVVQTIDATAFSRLFINAQAQSSVMRQQLVAIGWTGITITDDMLHSLHSCLSFYNINTKNKLCHFMSQCTIETMYGKRLVEQGDGSPNYFSKRDYDSKNLGNTTAGDGTLFKGAGYLQLTGRYNYQQFANNVGDPLIMTKGAQYVAGTYAWSSAGCFWDKMRGLNTLCNEGASVAAITKQVNGTGASQATIDARQTSYNQCWSIF